MGGESRIELGYYIQLDEVERWLSQVRPRKVLIQAPIGLKNLIPKMADELRSRGVEPIVSAGPCWGGCDVALREAEEVGADGIIHLGHAPFINISSIPVLYIEARIADPGPLMAMVDKVVLHLDGFSSVGLGATVQWLDHLERFAEELLARGFRVDIGRPSGHLIHRGQVLGCDYSTLKSIEDKVDCFLVIGSTFHALGIALTSKRPTLAVDPHNQKVEWMMDLARKVLVQRYSNILRFTEARRVGIIVSTKPGQMLLGLARAIREVLRENGYVADILTMDEVSETAIMENQYDAYVNTACPRLSIEDQQRFTKPLLLPAEVLVALRKLSWERLLEDGLLLATYLPRVSEV